MSKETAHAAVMKAWPRLFNLVLTDEYQRRKVALAEHINAMGAGAVEQQIKEKFAHYASVEQPSVPRRGEVGLWMVELGKILGDTQKGEDYFVIPQMEMVAREYAEAIVNESFKDSREAAMARTPVKGEAFLKELTWKKQMRGYLRDVGGVGVEVANQKLQRFKGEIKKITAPHRSEELFGIAARRFLESQGRQ
jgi:hypothetical protein